MTTQDLRIERRWEQLHTWGPYVLLGTGVVLAVASADPGAPAVKWYAAGGLVLAALVLQSWWQGARPRRAGRRAPSPAGTVYYFARWTLAFALTWLNPFFAFYAATGYMDADETLRERWQRLGLFASAVTVAGAQAGGLPLRSTVQWILFPALLVSNCALQMVVAHITAQEVRRGAERTATIAELEIANAALHRALDENAALHAQLLLQAREAGVADERRRLAAEIHDTLAQGLTGIIAQLQVVVNTPDPAAARVHTGRALGLARHSLGEARRSVHNLVPAALADDGLPDALRRTVTQWGERTGVRAEFTVTGDTAPLPDEVAATLLRIAEEALSNSARHARATRAGVTLSFMGGEISLDVRDDGHGFDPLAVPAPGRTGGFGLPGMRSRAERVAGSLTVESEPGQGTAVSARVPLPRHDR
jgi:signal transduction histidine kinase